MKIFSSIHQTLLTILIIHGGVLILRSIFVVYGFTDLHFEEAQYWMWSKRLDWSYYSKPPMIAYFNYISTTVLGDTELGIRINAIFLGFLTGFLIFFFSKELYGCNRKAFIASVLSYAMPFFQGSFLFFSTDSLVTFFWLLFMFLFWKSITYNKLLYFLLAGFSLGFGLLSKYTMFLAFPFIFFYIFIYNKKLFKNYKLYIFFGIALVCLFPLLIWSIKYDFINFRHVGDTVGLNSEPKNWSKQFIKLMEYIGSQLIIISPLFLVMYFKIFRNISLKNKPTIYLLLAPLMSFLIFTIVSLVRGSGANINWPMFAYGTLPILLANYIVEKRRFISYNILFSLTIVMLIFMIQTPLLDKVGLGKLLPPSADPAKKIVGWEELGAKISDIKSNIGNKSFVFSNTYYPVTEMSFYMKNQPFAYYYNVGNRMSQFALWSGLEQFENKDFNAIYLEITDIGKKRNAHLNKPKEIDIKILNAFDELIDYQMHTIRFRNKDMYLCHIYVLKNFKSLKSKKKGY